MSRLFKHWSRDKELSAQAFVEKELDGSDYERGAVEEAQATANKVKEAFSRLVATLYKFQAISDADVFFIAKGFEPENAPTVAKGDQ